MTNSDTAKVPEKQSTHTTSPIPAGNSPGQGLTVLFLSRATVLHTNKMPLDKSETLRLISAAHRTHRLATRFTW